MSRRPWVILAILSAGFLPMSRVGFGQTTGDLAPPVRLMPDQDAAPGREAGATAQSATDLAKKLQNPIGDLISVPFQNSTNFNVGPHDGAQNILNIQPVTPIHLNQDWNVITRMIPPLVWSPSFEPAPSVPFGTAPTSFSAFLSPKNPVNG